MGKAERERKARAAERRPNAMAVPLAPFHPEPIYAALCAERGYLYDAARDGVPKPLRHADQWYWRTGWPPVPFWISHLGNWFEWDEATETYVNADDLDPVPPHLKDQIMASIRRGDLVWDAVETARMGLGRRRGITTLRTILDPVERTLAEHGYVSPPPLPDGGTDWPEAARRMLARDTPEHHDTDGHRARVDGRHGIRSGGITWAVVPDERAAAIERHINIYGPDPT